MPRATTIRAGYADMQAVRVPSQPDSAMPHTIPCQQPNPYEADAATYANKASRKASQR
ncbi:hypothetical protein ACX12D_25050 [Cupriavidus sp. PET2-C1]